MHGRFQFAHEREELEAEKKTFQEECAQKSRELAQLRSSVQGRRDKNGGLSDAERRANQLEKEVVVQASTLINRYV